MMWHGSPLSLVSRGNRAGGTTDIAFKSSARAMTNEFTPSADKPLEPGDRLGRYEIREQIGQGGMGTVFRARDTLPPIAGREVAIKVLISGMFDPDSLQRFLAEAHALSRLEHPNIVRIIDCVAEEARPFIVMEYLKGEDLNKLLRRGPVDVARAVDIVLSICAAIYACHRRGIIHRDLKPENVMLHCPEPDYEIVKLLDFSVSKSTVRPDLTNNGFLPGTPRYMSPEQASGAVADARSDQYAIALLLHVLLVRQKPFAELEKPSLSVIARGMPNRARILRPEVPDGLDVVIARALRVDPAQRFASVHELGSKLLPFSSESARGRWTQMFTSTPPAAVSPKLLSGPAPTVHPSGAAGAGGDVHATTEDERDVSTARATAMTSALRKNYSAVTTKSVGQVWYDQSPSGSDEDPGRLDLPTPSAPPVTLESRPIQRSWRTKFIVAGALVTAGAAVATLRWSFKDLPVQPPPSIISGAPSPQPSSPPVQPSIGSPPSNVSAGPATGERAGAPDSEPADRAATAESAVVERPARTANEPKRRRNRQSPRMPSSPPARPRGGVEYTDDGSPVLR